MDREEILRWLDEQDREEEEQEERDRRRGETRCSDGDSWKHLAFFEHQVRQQYPPTQKRRSLE